MRVNKQAGNTATGSARAKQKGNPKCLEKNRQNLGFSALSQKYLGAKLI